jgi:CMP-N,N'-diacetyllegionaminic acid synthase
MTKNKILVVVPARAGSKGIPKKNISLVSDKPLISYTLDFITKISWVDFLIVSTDSTEIQSIGSKYGAITTGLRPIDLSGDFIGDLPVLRWETLELEKKLGIKIDYVLMLQPTSPIRNLDFINEATQKLISLKFDSIVSVQKVNLKYNPLKQFVINDDRLAYYDDSGANVFARQQLDDTYIRDGVYYGFDRDFIFASDHVIGSNSSFLVNPNKSINIDNLDDLKEFQTYIDNHYYKNK